MPEQNKLFLFDAYALIYRSYFAFINAPRRTTWGLNSSAPYGFTNTIIDVIKNEQPTHVAVVFDPGGPTFRHQMYDKYKANRQEMPEELRASIPYVKQIVEAMNIQLVQVEGYEADDVIGTMAKQARAQGLTTYLMTPDKDYCQLVEPGIFIYRPRSFGAGIEVLDTEAVKQKFSINDPSQVIDILGLWGDSSDNIPGAPGIGEKRAKELIATYGSIENIYNHIDELKGKQKENLLAYKDQILLSKDLATIRINAPVTIDVETLKYTGPSRQKLLDLFKHLEFRTLSLRLFPETSSQPEPRQATAVQGSLFDTVDDTVDDTVAQIVPGQTPLLKNIKDVEHHYELVDTPQKRQELITMLMNTQEFCFDTETTSLDIISAQLVGLSFSTGKARGWYVPFPENQDQAQLVADEFKTLFAAMHIAKVGQNMKYDISVLARYGIEVQGRLFDTLIAHYVLQPELRHNLDFLAETYLDYRMVPIEDLIGKKGVHQKNFRDVPVEIAKEYSCEDADVTFQVKQILQLELERKGLTRLFADVEMPLVTILSGIERQGVSINTDALRQSSSELKEQIKTIEETIHEMAGMQFNISSPKQLGEVLFERMKISEKAKKTKTQQYSTGEEVLSLLKNQHPIVEHILDYRELKKLVSTYIDSLPALIHPLTGRVHTSYNQAIVSTGRLSSTNPNLQNIPVRTNKGREIRKAFIPRSEHHTFVSADYSQIELRIIAHISGDEDFIAAFNNNEDIHAATAAKIFGVTPDQVSSDQRRQAKSANFAISYGSSAFGLSQNLNISRKDAQFLIDGYFATYPRVKEFMERQVATARQQGYVETILGRRRYLPDINSNNATVRSAAERTAINAPIQGSAADIIKMAMIQIEKNFTRQNITSRMIMQVHDELNFDVLLAELELVKHIVRDSMQSAYMLKVPLIVDIGTGNNWLEAH